jgi:hypothetical protein
LKQQIFSTEKTINLQIVFKNWWPLAFSWLLMGTELPALSAVVARLPDPEINLAAYGGVVFPLALVIESPVIMLLAASTALSKDWDSYHKIWRFMMFTSAILTGIHILVAFTPFYYLVVEGLLKAPQEIVEPARIGLMIMTPWTWSIAYRRFNQGVLIRFNHARLVTTGTIIRLSADILVLLGGYLIGNVSGIIVATSAVAAGVICEAVFAGIAVHPVINKQLKSVSPIDPPLSLGNFLAFYIPLVMTSFLTLLANPIGSAALGRMPLPLESLAAWPVVTGLIFMLRSLGLAYNEVVVALLDQPGAAVFLKRFATLLALATSGLLFLIIATPISSFWFLKVSALSPQLAVLARTGMWSALILPALSVMQSWYQGLILHGRRTRGITEAVLIYLGTSGILLTIGIAWGQTIGLYVGVFVLAVSVLAQTTWLRYRSLPVLEKIMQETQ